MGKPGPGRPRGTHNRTFPHKHTAGQPSHRQNSSANASFFYQRQVEDDIEGCFQRPTHIDITVASREYAPTAGIKPLREAVAKMYNAHHREGKESQYTWENVAIVPGGRAGLIRIAAILNQAYLGFFIPDYTAYNEMLSLFRNVSVTMCL